MSKAGARVIRGIILYILVELCSIAFVYAQAEKNSFEVGIEAGPFIAIASGGHETVGVIGLGIEPHVGYFVTDALVVGATGFFFHSLDSDPSQPSIFFGAAYVHINYHFNSGGTWSPYIGGRIGVFDPYSEKHLIVGIQVGLQYFVARQFSINGQLDVGVIPGSAGVGFLSCLGLGFSFHIN